LASKKELEDEDEFEDDYDSRELLQLLTLEFRNVLGGGPKNHPNAER